jgi:hypothetical protein
MGGKPQISFLKSCFLLDEDDRVEVMQSYADEIDVTTGLVWCMANRRAELDRQVEQGSHSIDKKI